MYIFVISSNRQLLDVKYHYNQQTQPIINTILLYKLSKDQTQVQYAPSRIKILLRAVFNPLFTKVINHIKFFNPQKIISFTNSLNALLCLNNNKREMQQMEIQQNFTTTISFLAHLPILKNKLKLLKQEELPTIQTEIQNLLHAAKLIFEAKEQNMETKLLPLILSWAQGKNTPAPQLQNIIVTEVGGEPKYWKKFLPKYLQLKQFEDNTKQWEVKKKYLELIKDYHDVQRVKWVREVKFKYRKLIEAFNKMIRDIEGNTLSEDALNEQHLKLLKSEIDFSKLLKSNGVKVIKTKKKEQIPPNPVTVNQQKQQPEPNVNQQATPYKKNMDAQPSTQGAKEQEGSEAGKQNKGQQQGQQLPSIGKQQKTKKSTKKKPVKEVTVEVKSATPQSKIFSNFFKPKGEKQVKISEQQIQIIPKPTQDNRISKILNLLYSQISFEEIQKQFYGVQRSRSKKLTHLYIQDNGFYLQNCKLPYNDVDPLYPCAQFDKINYDNSYAEYSQYRQYLVQQDIQNQEDRSEDQQESVNRSIVSDSYVSFEDGVSESLDEQKCLKGQIKFGEKYTYNYKTASSLKNQYRIFVVDDMACPLQILPPPKQPISSAQKLQLIRILHGSYDNTQKLLQKLSEKLQPLTKTAIRNYMQQFSSKQSGRRMIKPYFLDQMKEMIENEQINLEEIVKSKQQQNRQERQQRRALNRQRRQQKKKQHELERQARLPFLSGGMDIEQEQRQQPTAMQEQSHL